MFGLGFVNVEVFSKAFSPQAGVILFKVFTMPSWEEESHNLEEGKETSDPWQGRNELVRVPGKDIQFVEDDHLVLEVSLSHVLS